MKNVLGGRLQTVSCVYTGPSAQVRNASAPKYNSSNTVTATIQQAIADDICAADDGCTGVDCPGSM